MELLIVKVPCNRIEWNSWVILSSNSIASLDQFDVEQSWRQESIRPSFRESRRLESISTIRQIASALFQNQKENKWRFRCAQLNCDASGRAEELKLGVVG